MLFIFKIAITVANLKLIEKVTAAIANLLFWYHFVDRPSLIQNRYKYPILELVKNSQN